MAEFLRLAGDAVKKKEIEILAKHNFLMLNEAQCRRLWQNLKVVYLAFAPSLFYPPRAQEMCFPLYKEFYSVVMCADAIVEKCSSEQSWLEAAIFFGGNQRVFQELSLELQSCGDLFYYLTKSLFRNSQIPAPSNVVDVACLDVLLNEDLHKDVTSLRTRLEERQFGFTEQEKHLASYIVERDVFVPEPVLELEPDPKLPFYEVHRQDSLHLEMLGVGASGAVSKVKWLGMICAKKEFLGLESTVGFVKEVCALVALNHSRTVKLLCSSRRMPTPYFIMELMPMTLKDFCKKKDASDNMRFEILPSINMMLQIALGMEYLHEQGVVHRDLKSPNILVSPSVHPGLCSEGYGSIKLTDFGLAKMKVSDASMMPTCRLGTTQWLAPEVLGINGPPAYRIAWKKVDTYSFAIVCSEILTGETPYLGMLPGKEMIEGVSLGRLRPKLPQDCPIYLSRFLSRCWAPNPHERPDFKEITQTLSNFKTCLLICTVPEQAHAVVVSPFKKFWTFWGVPNNEISVRAPVFCPYPEEKKLVESAVEYMYSRMEMMEALCGRMEEHLKMAQMCHFQCEHLVQKYSDGFQEVKGLFKLVSPADFWKHYQSKKLQQFSESMDRLICSMMAVEELLRACGGSKWMMTALVVFSAPPQTGKVCSIFGLHLWNLYWNLFVINHVMHDVTARQASTGLQVLNKSSTLRVQWCQEKNKPILQKISSTGFEDAEDEFLQADAHRQAEDHNNMISNVIKYSHERYLPISCIAQICSRYFLPEEPINNGLAVFLKDRLQSTADPLDFVSYKFDDLNLEDGKLIGHGSLKKVVKQKWYGETVAVAIIVKCSEYIVQLDVFMHEIKMLAKLRHPNVVDFIGWELDQRSQHGYIMMELMEEDLHNLIERNARLYSRSPFSLFVAIDILLQVVEAMIHIHKCGVIYRDLKPRNILVSPKYTTKLNPQDLDVYYTVKLTDFQTARMWSSKNYTEDHDREAFEMPSSSECVFTTRMVGTGAYRAPEIMKGRTGTTHNEGYTFSVDVYSFGMTAYQVATGSPPFESKSPKEIGPSAIRGERPLLPDDCSRGLKELIEKCWAGIPEDRPTFEQIRKDLWTLKYHTEIQR